MSTLPSLSGVTSAGARPERGGLVNSAFASRETSDSENRPAAGGFYSIVREFSNYTSKGVVLVTRGTGFARRIPRRSGLTRSAGGVRPETSRRGRRPGTFEARPNVMTARSVAAGLGRRTFDRIVGRGERGAQGAVFGGVAHEVGRRAPRGPVVRTRGPGHARIGRVRGPEPRRAGRSSRLGCGPSANRAGALAIAFVGVHATAFGQDVKNFNKPLLVAETEGHHVPVRSLIWVDGAT